VLDFNRVVRLDNILQGGDGICTRRNQAARRNAHRLVGFECTGRRSSCGDAVDDWEPPRRVGRAQGEAIHRGAVERRQIDGRRCIVDEHPALRGFEADALRR
jgi:hypothetical protein